MRLSWKILMTHLLHSSCKKEKKWRGKEVQGNTKRGSIWLMKYWNIFLASGRTCQLFYKTLKICRERYKVMNEFTLRNININITVLLISGAFLIYLWPLFLSTAWACYLRPMRVEMKFINFITNIRFSSQNTHHCKLAILYLLILLLIL